MKCPSITREHGVTLSCSRPADHAGACERTSRTRWAGSESPRV
jgi:hypothetical protein